MSWLTLLGCLVVLKIRQQDVQDRFYSFTFADRHISNHIMIQHITLPDNDSTQHITRWWFSTIHYKIMIQQAHYKIMIEHSTLQDHESAQHMQTGIDLDWSCFLHMFGVFLCQQTPSQCSEGKRLLSAPNLNQGSFLPRHRLIKYVLDKMPSFLGITCWRFQLKEKTDHPSTICGNQDYVCNATWHPNGKMCHGIYCPFNPDLCQADPEFLLFCFL